MDFGANGRIDSIYGRVYICWTRTNVSFFTWLVGSQSPCHCFISTFFGRASLRVSRLWLNVDGSVSNTIQPIYTTIAPDNCIFLIFGAYIIKNKNKMNLWSSIDEWRNYSNNICWQSVLSLYYSYLAHSPIFGIHTQFITNHVVSLFSIMFYLD